MSTIDYEILADMSADIDRQSVKEKRIRYVPMEYSIGDRTLTSIGPEDDANMHHFYESMRKNLPTHTSQISPYQYETAFDPYIKA